MCSKKSFFANWSCYKLIMNFSLYLQEKLVNSIFELCLSIIMGKPIVNRRLFFVWRANSVGFPKSWKLASQLNADWRNRLTGAKRELGFVLHLVKNLTRKVAPPLTRHTLRPARLAIKFVRLRHKYWSLLLVMLLVPQSNQFCCSSRFLFYRPTNFITRHVICATVQPNLLLVMQEGVCDFLAMIFSLWNKQRWRCVYYTVRMLSKRLMKTKSTSYQNWTNRACCLTN